MKPIIINFAKNVLMVTLAVVIFGLPLALTLIFQNWYFMFLWIISIAIEITYFKSKE